MLEDRGMMSIATISQEAYKAHTSENLTAVQETAAQHAGSS